MRTPTWFRLLAAVLPPLVAATAAVAAITPDAKKVVDHYVTATGGRASYESMRTVTTYAHVSALGLAGTTTTYAERPNRRASYTQLGPFLIPEGVSDTIGWRVDPSGRLLMLDAKDLEDAREGAWFENVMWLTPGEGGGSVRVAATEKDGGQTYDVLEVTPPMGTSRRYWVNQKTGLIDREGTKHDQQQIEGTLSDYRSVGGRLVPFLSVERIVGMPANDLTIRVDSIVFNAPIDPARFAPPAPEANRLTWLKTPGHASLPFHYNSRHVWVKASVNGRPPADFLFDTGASITIIDSTYAAGLGLTTQGELQGQGAGAAGSARFSEIQSLKIPGDDGDGVEFAGQKVGVLSINPFLEPFFWRGCAGVIGADFISRVVTRIDYDHSRLDFYDPKTFHYDGPGKAVPFALAGNMPAVHMTLDDRYSGDFRVDVGSSSTVDLHSPFVERNELDKKVKGKKIDVIGGGFGGTFTSTLTRMTKLQLGPVHVDRADAHVLRREDRRARERGLRRQHRQPDPRALPLHVRLRAAAAVARAGRALRREGSLLALGRPARPLRRRDQGDPGHSRLTGGQGGPRPGRRRRRDRRQAGAAVDAGRAAAAVRGRRARAHGHDRVPAWRQEPHAEAEARRPPVGSV
jgi:hypothetical protein